ncbi:septum formation protein Maf [Candidatus Beckwithbacteria bacterium]|nr:septum formation protein Maf [Candidatus Beckwithbacteria bacterium]
MQIILGSQSPRRKQLLKFLIDDFVIKNADLDEDSFAKLARTPEELVTKLSLTKAKKVAQNLKAESLIIAADTIVVLQNDQDNSWGEIIGKPKDLRKAQQILQKLQGRKHEVYTGFTVLNTKKKQFFTDFEMAAVYFQPLNLAQIDRYIDKFKPLDKAGAYAIQELSREYIAKYEGSLSTIIGLPLEKLVKVLEKFGVKVKKDWQQKVKDLLLF